MRVDSLFILGLHSDALVLASGVLALEMTKPYLSVCTGLMGVIAASEVASATQHSQ